MWFPFKVKVSAGVWALQIPLPGFSGPFSATHGHGVTIRIRYFHVSDVQCSSLKITCSWDTSILCDDRPSFNLHFFYFYLPTAIPLTFLSSGSLRDGESLAGNECRGCLISASVCRANWTGSGHFPSLLMLRGWCGNFGYFGLTLKEKRRNWLPSETGYRQSKMWPICCGQFISFHIATYTIYNMCLFVCLFFYVWALIWWKKCHECDEFVSFYLRLK